MTRLLADVVLTALLLALFLALLRSETVHQGMMPRT